MRKLLKYILLLLFYLGVLYNLFFNMCMVLLLITSLRGQTLLGDTPHFPEPGFWGMLCLLILTTVISAYLTVGKSPRFRQITLGFVYLTAAVSLLFIVVGLVTNNRFTGDETNMGSVWISMAAIYWLLIRIKDLQTNRSWVFAPTPTS